MEIEMVNFIEALIEFFKQEMKTGNPPLDNANKNVVNSLLKTAKSSSGLEHSGRPDGELAE